MKDIIVTIGNNNLSRALFKEFIERNRLSRPVRDSRNVVIVGDALYAFTIGDQNQRCRQFYDDCDGIYIYTDGVVAIVLREECEIGAITRITPQGKIARDANYSGVPVRLSIFS